MNLRKKLKEHRYGERNIIVPDRLTTREYMQPRDRIRRPIKNLDDLVMSAFLHPPKRDRYYKHYIYIPNLYHETISSMTAKARTLAIGDLINHHLAAKLAYMLEHPSQYGEFIHFRYAWLSNALFAMRNTIIKQKYLDPNDDLTTTRSSAINSIIAVPYPKPMSLVAMGMLADKLFDIIHPRSEYLLSLRD